ncbi:MAG TPA: NYN domain-containing protein [Planctomycetota bacterium]|nr:NYN domain-containing protein [Planctomycetota bacterium]
MNAAVFVDFENLFLSLKNRTDGPGVRTRESSLQILEGLLARLREEGNPMVLGRSYAAFDTYPGVEVAHDLALMGLDPQYVLISHSGKNSADIQLALDTARVVFRRSDIPLIVIVSGDRDFIPLARQVLEEGRELVVVAIPDTTSGDLRERVGLERFWNALDLIKWRPQTDKGAQASSAAKVGDAPAGPMHANGNGNGHGAANGSGGNGNGSSEEEPAAARTRTAPASAVANLVAAQYAASAQAQGMTPAPQVRGDEAPNVVGHIPVTWKTQRSVSPEEHEERLRQCLELMVRAQIRHDSPDIWLSPFLKGPMSQHFSNLVHPERRALINDLRSRGVIRVEERDNMYADHPYSVIVIDESHPMAQAARNRVVRGA